MANVNLFNSIFYSLQKLNCFLSSQRQYPSTFEREMISRNLLSFTSTLLVVTVINCKPDTSSSRINRATINLMVDGWMRADTSNMEDYFDEDWVGWVPTGQLNSFAEFANFFASFKDSAFENTGWYNVTFYNFIEWEEDTRMYQTAQWTLDGFDGGLYSFMSEKGLAKRARIGRFPANNTQLTFERKELCNKPDNICKSNSIRAPKTSKPRSQFI